MSGFSRRIDVLAMFDWYSLLKQVDENEKIAVVERSKLALKHGCRILEKAISNNESSYFRVTIRLYGGWSKGFERTDFFKSVRQVPEAYNVSEFFRSPKIDVVQDLQFGDRLLNALEARMHPGLGIHLPSTSRDQGGKKPSEKMVDTALASDLCFWCSTEPLAWAVVVSNDDDMIPPVMSAEGYLVNCPGKVMLVHGGIRKKSARYLRLEGLVYDQSDFA